jgi:hypothetical protein
METTTSRTIIRDAACAIVIAVFGVALVASV